MGQRNRKELIQILQKQGRSTELESLLGNAEIAIIAQHQANLALSYHRVAWPPSPTAHWPLEHHHAPHLAGERRSRFASDGLPSMCDHATHRICWIAIGLHRDTPPHESRSKCWKGTPRKRYGWTRSTRPKHTGTPRPWRWLSADRSLVRGLVPDHIPPEFLSRRACTHARSKSPKKRPSCAMRS